MRRFLILFVVLFFPIQTAHARRSVRKLTHSWEKMMVNQIIQGYYCSGILGDLYRAKTYSKGKTKRYLQTLFGLLGREKLFLVKRTKKGSHSQRKYFRHLLATTDMILLSVHTLQKILNRRPEAKMSAYLRYRSAAAQNINKMLRHPLRKRRRHYRGGWRTGLKHLGHHLGSGLALGYLATGILADAYFQRVLPKGNIIGYLTPIISLAQSSAKSLAVVRKMVSSADRSYINQVQMGQKAVLQEAQSLHAFIRTRKRKFLKLYIQMRRFAWSTIRPFAAP